MAINQKSHRPDSSFSHGEYVTSKGVLKDEREAYALAKLELHKSELRQRMVMVVTKMGH